MQGHHMARTLSSNTEFPIRWEKVVLISLTSCRTF